MINQCDSKIIVNYSNNNSRTYTNINNANNNHSNIIINNYMYNIIYYEYTLEGNLHNLLLGRRLCTLMYYNRANMFLYLSFYSDT